jgi:uncharacterized protein (TIGR02246 family)
MEEKSMKYFIAINVIITMLFGCAPKVDLEAEKTAVKETIDQMPKAIESEDMDTFSDLMVHDPDMVNFGTDASERWVGWDALKASMEQQNAAFEDSKVSTRDQVIKVHDSGQVAWFSELVDWSTVTQGQQVNMKGIRLTGVLEKQNGKWKFAQVHFSVGVAGQAAEY